MVLDQWTPRVTARSELADLLLKQPSRYESANLVKSDLERISASGRRCIEADAMQKEQLAEGSAARSERKDAGAALVTAEQMLRSVAVAVVNDLMTDHPREALFLSRLSFARFRTRELEKPAEGPASEGDEVEEIKNVERVPREDHLTRARGLAGYCNAVLRPGREAIVEKFDSRKLGRAVLEKVAKDAAAYAEGGRNVKVAAEATAREAEAAAEQKAMWSAVRRLVRNAVRGDATLEAKFAEC